jgi:hypothetical protein
MGLPAASAPLVGLPTMAGRTGIHNLAGMRGRRKSGAITPQADAPQAIAANAEAFRAHLTHFIHLAARAYFPGSIDVHRWALRVRLFVAWAAGRGTHDPAAFTRVDLAGYQLFLHR